MWLRNIKDVYRLHREELEAISNQEEREDRLTELNVQEQVLHLGKNFHYPARMETSTGSGSARTGLWIKGWIAEYDFYYDSR